MASYSVADSEVGAYNKTLVASTVDTVTFGDESLARIEVESDGAAALYFTVDGSAPTVGGANTYRLPAYPSVRDVPTPRRSTATSIEVKLISSGTPAYSVSKVD